MLKVSISKRVTWSRNCLQMNIISYLKIYNCMKKRDWLLHWITPQGLTSRKTNQPANQPSIFSSLQCIFYCLSFIPLPSPSIILLFILQSFLHFSCSSTFIFSLFSLLPFYFFSLYFLHTILLFSSESFLPSFLFFVRHIVHLHFL